MAGLCEFVIGSMNRGPSAKEKQMKKVAEAIETLYADLSEETGKLKQLKQDYKLIANTKNQIDPTGLPRDILLKNISTKAKRQKTKIDHIYSRIGLTEKLHSSLQDSHMSSELVSYYKEMKRNLIDSGISEAELEQMVDDNEDVAEKFIDLDQSNVEVSSLINAWQTPSDQNTVEEDAFIKSYLLDDDLDESVFDPSKKIVTPITINVHAQSKNDLKAKAKAKADDARAKAEAAVKAAEVAQREMDAIQDAVDEIEDNANTEVKKDAIALPI